MRSVIKALQDTSKIRIKRQVTTRKLSEDRIYTACAEHYLKSPEVFIPSLRRMNIDIDLNYWRYMNQGVLRCVTRFSFTYVCNEILVWQCLVDLVKQYLIDSGYDCNNNGAPWCRGAYLTHRSCRATDGFIFKANTIWIITSSR